MENEPWSEAEEEIAGEENGNHSNSFIGFPEDVPLSYFIDELKKSASRWGVNFVTFGTGNHAEFAIEHIANDIRQLFYGEQDEG